MNLFNELIDATPQPKAIKNIAGRLPNISGVNAKKIEEVRELLYRIEAKDQQTWSLILRQWGPQGEDLLSDIF